ncbi:MAG: patatin-like phospholipase family protein [Solirubrobacterales bacterium]
MQFEPLSPVRHIPGDEERAGPEQGIALCLSGGGYRAMLFHLGSLWRLNEWGYLPRIARISSVSGGSIVAAALGRNWGRLEFNDKVATNFDAEVVAPVRSLAGKTIDSRAIGIGLFTPGSINRRVVNAYRRHLFGDSTLQDLPRDDEGPRFVINATNLQSGVLWRFSRPYAWDYKVGKIAEPRIPLAVAVGASSAFPPFLSPARLSFSEDEFEPGTGEELQQAPYTTRPVLSDGGVYDNLGLETAWKRYRTVLISDGGGAMEADGGDLGPLGWRWRDWGTQFVRVLFTIDNQVRSLRKRQAIAAFESDGEEGREGTYWGVRSDIEDYDLDSSLSCPSAATKKLAETPTRLKRLDSIAQERLINWGYAICDTAMRKWVDPGLSRVPPRFPYPDVGVGP